MTQSAPMQPVTRKWVACGVISAAALGAWWLHGHSPTSSGWYPPCYFHALTGLHCPGCGATRAAYALLHGQLGVAFHQNALAVLALPFIAWAAGRSFWRWVRALPPLLRPTPDPWAVRLTLLLAPLVILFGIARNLPWSPFTLLAPY